MADDSVRNFGLGAVLGGLTAYWLRGALNRAERAGRAVGADAYGMAGSGTFEGTVSPAEVLAERAERAGRGVGAQRYGSEPVDEER
jgi:hypothetical protein